LWTKKVIRASLFVWTNQKKEHNMTGPTMTLMELLRENDVALDTDFLREGVRTLMQLLIELEASHQVGAGRYERTGERQTYRNGNQPGQWETRVGEIPLQIPKLREGSYFPSLLEPRKRSEQALLAVVQQA
jgi:transposase-like protein